MSVNIVLLFSICGRGFDHNERIVLAAKIIFWEWNLELVVGILDGKLACFLTIAYLELFFSLKRSCSAASVKIFLFNFRQVLRQNILFSFIL